MLPMFSDKYNSIKISILRRASFYVTHTMEGIYTPSSSISVAYAAASED